MKNVLVRPALEDDLTRVAELLRDCGFGALSKGLFRCFEKALGAGAHP